MAIIQIRNAAGSKDNKEREELPKRDLITKRAMRKIVAIHIENYEILRRKHTATKEQLQWSHHNESVLLRQLNTQKLWFYISAVANVFLAGGVVWLIQ